MLLLVYAVLERDATAIVAIGALAVLARIALSVGILRKCAFAWRRYGAFVTCGLEALLIALVLGAALPRLFPS